MFCKECGNQIADEAKFCPKCGAAVAAVETVANESTGSVSEAVNEVVNHDFAPIMDGAKAPEAPQGQPAVNPNPVPVQPVYGQGYTPAGVPKDMKKAIKIANIVFAVGFAGLFIYYLISTFQFFGVIPDLGSYFGFGCGLFSTIFSVFRLGITVCCLAMALLYAIIAFRWDKERLKPYFLGSLAAGVALLALDLVTAIIGSIAGSFIPFFGSAAFSGEWQNFATILIGLIVIYGVWYGLMAAEKINVTSLINTKDIVNEVKAAVLTLFAEVKEFVGGVSGKFNK